MHPALSVIVFTVSSGIGYGMLFWLAINVAFGNLPVAGVTQWSPERGFGIAAFGVAFALIVVGLLSSTFHLGHPERAWRALSQWRSSWLSREGVMAIATFVPTGLFAVGWVIFGCVDGWWLVAGIVGALCCLATTVCTAMIYASLKPVGAWHCIEVPLLYMLLSLASGAVWLTAVARVLGAPFGHSDLFYPAGLALALCIKLLFWWRIDRLHGELDNPRAPARGTAIGLPAGAAVQPLDPPHTEENYLMKEMGFAVARRHARKLRRLSVLLAFALPILAWFLQFWVSAPVMAALMVAGAIAMTLGLLIERWLFFAEAKHSVMLYYRGDEAP